MEQARLDVLHVMPTGQAWHKSRTLTDARHRVAMAGLAFAAVPGVVVDDRETRRSGATYTIDTLRELAAEHPQAQLVLLMGQDQAEAFSTWRAWQDIAAMAELWVAGRGDAPLPELPQGLTMHRLSLPRMPDSATDIRARLAGGQDITRLVPPGVAGYIAQHHLYQII
jgi:nicotinate-nucleotide adenylyltransferase